MNNVNNINSNEDRHAILLQALKANTSILSNITKTMAAQNENAGSEQISDTALTKFILDVLIPEMEKTGLVNTIFEAFARKQNKTKNLFHSG